MCFDLTDRCTFNQLKYWFEEISMNARDSVKILLVGNKSDLLDKRQVEKKEVETFAEQMGCEYVETSAKSASNIEEAVLRLSTSILHQKSQQNKKKMEKESISSSVSKIGYYFNCGGCTIL